MRWAETMTGLTNTKAFNTAAGGTPARKKAPPPVSVRLTWVEYERLLQDAGALSMAAYIRLTLFGDGDIAPHRKPYTRKTTSPSAELTMLGQMLGRLVQSGTAASLSEIALAAKVGALPVSPEVEGEISKACDAVGDLIGALGVKASRELITERHRSSSVANRSLSAVNGLNANH